MCQQNNWFEVKILLLEVSMSTNDKVQFKLTIQRDLYNKLESLADKTGKNSGQEVVMELIAIYLPVWQNVNESMNRAIQYQTNLIANEAITRKKDESLNSTDFKDTEIQTKDSLEQSSDRLNPEKSEKNEIPKITIKSDEDLKQFRENIGKQKTKKKE